jgi:hypothetical protein
MTRKKPRPMTMAKLTKKLATFVKKYQPADRGPLGKAESTLFVANFFGVKVGIPPSGEQHIIVVSPSDLHAVYRDAIVEEIRRNADEVTAFILREAHRVH